MSKKALLVIVLLAALLRAWAALQLPVDFDEPVYVKAGLDYAAAIRAGDWNAVVDYPQNREHPALVKLLFGAALLATGANAGGDAMALLASRSVSVLFGTLAAVLLALASPLAGGLLAVHTLAVKYTGQAYLEAVPQFASLAAVLALARSAGRRDRLFWLSAAALGLAAAGKYSYWPIAFPVLYLLLEKRVGLRVILLYFLVTASVFLLLNPTLWHDPLTRLAGSLSFHTQYAQGDRVQQSGYAWFQPLAWMFTSVPWHPEVFFYRGIDELIFLAAAAGLVWQWRERRWLAIWLLAGTAVLLLWPTKWPQYTLNLTAALCLAASSTAQQVLSCIREREAYWHWFGGMLPRPTRGFWIATALFILLLAGAYMASRVQAALLRLSWTYLTAENSLLPSNSVYDLVAVADGMIMATERGVAWYMPSATGAGEGAGSWTVYTAENSGLAHDRVLAVMQDRSGFLWFGTQAGLSRYAGGAWQTYRAGDIGLAAGQVQALAIGSDGRLWIGTSAGAASYDGRTWRTFTANTSPLADDSVLSVAVEPRNGADVIWLGTLTGVSRFDTATNQWSTYTSANSDLGWGGVADMMVDAGVVWAAALGGGLSRWTGAGWQTYRTANSGIPLNTVNRVVALEPGILWVLTSLPTRAGGVPAVFDGKTWQAYTQAGSGYGGAEPLAIASDAAGRLWIGTRTAGVAVFKPPHRDGGR